jgi:uncharacterized protein (DUF1800 family)
MEALCEIPPRLVRARRVAWLMCVVLAGALAALPGCAPARKPERLRPDVRLSAQDLALIERVTFGVDSRTLATYAGLGRAAFLNEQLRARAGDLPASVREEIQAAAGALPADPGDRLSAVARENRRINALPQGAERDAARKALGDTTNRAAFAALDAHLLRALYSPNQLQEQMVWFWENHFSVFADKGNVRLVLADYEDRAIRPHALGHFRDLVMATLMHPAMLTYLDNAQNAAGHLNENYARELMELHTLGVTAGYTQQDVQQLARILTGVGIAGERTPKLQQALKRQYVRAGAFEFNPARHDFGPKVLLGRRIAPRGFAEVQQAVDLIVRQPACAQYISHKLAVYFLGREPSPALATQLARVFRASDGDITVVLRTLFAAPEFDASLGGELKDPLHFVISALRLAYDGRALPDLHPVLNWLGTLGERPFAHQTPEGYGLAASAWSSSGQLARRFEIARRIAAGGAGPLAAQGDNASPGTAASGAQPAVRAGGIPRLSPALYVAAFEPRLSERTRAVLERASSSVEWNTLVLASPEFNYH